MLLHCLAGQWRWWAVLWCCQAGLLHWLLLQLLTGLWAPEEALLPVPVAAAGCLLLLLPAAGALQVVVTALQAVVMTSETCWGEAWVMGYLQAVGWCRM